MDVAGSAFPITPLLATCTKIVTILHNVGKKFKRAPLMMTSIATECSLIHVALAQLRSFDWAAIIANAEGRQEQLTRATESIILGCTLTLSVIEEYAVELQDYVDGAPLSPTEQMGIMARVRVLWKEDEMRELLLQLRGYQTGLTGLIRAAHDSDLSSEEGDAIGNTSNYTMLLQRSRSSRARKPLSIRAAMQQAATYTSMAQPGATPSTTSLASTATVQSRQSTAASSITSSAASTKLKDGESFSSVAGEASGSGHAGRKGSSDTTKRVKRPAFLTLAPEDSESVKEGQSFHVKKSKDQLRKSSPTVGDKFEYVPGMPPPPTLTAVDPPLKSAPPVLNSRDSLTAQSDADAKKAKRPSKDSFHEPPTSSPPQVPLPEPPSNPVSRSPSRSRSPAPKSPIRSILRNASNTDLTSGGASHRRKGSGAKTLRVDDQSHQDGSSTSEGEPRKAGTPQTDASRFPTPRSDSLPSPRKQRSNSSVRDQIMVLPETARLRKQASNELLRKQTSAELLGTTGFHDAMPAMPAQAQDRVVMGNAFGRRESNSSGAPQNTMSPISRTSSFDMLTDAGRKRSGTDTTQQAAPQERKAQIPLQQKRGVQRSASDARRPGNLKYLSVDSKSDDAHSPTSDTVTTPSTIPTPSSQTAHSTSTGTDSWPLNQQHGYQGELSQHQSHYGSRLHLHSAERAYAPSPTFDRRSLSPESTPRVSRSITPYTNTSGQRSRTNTLMTIESEVGDTDKSTIGEGSSSGYGSGTPSVVSSQWYKSPQERLNIGPRVSVAESIPWELGDEDDLDEEPLTRFHPTPRLGTSLETTRGTVRPADDGRPQSPPRSPLLTDGFLVNVKAGLPKDDPANKRMPPPSEAPSTRPSTSMNSYSTGSGSSNSKGSKKEKEKKKKEKKPGKVTMRDLWGAYKGSSNTLYSATYARAADEQRVDAERRSITNSSSTSGSTRVHSSMDGQIPPSTKGSKIVSPRQSIERGASVSSGSTSSRLTEKDKKKKSGGGLFTMKELWSEYKSSTNTWYTGAYKEENVRHLETPDLLGRN